MIVVTVELKSANGREHDKLLGIATITNVGGNAAYGIYKVFLGKMAPRTRQAWKEEHVGIPLEIVEIVENVENVDYVEGDIEKFDRLKRGPWDLLYVALKAIVGERNP